MASSPENPPDLDYTDTLWQAADKLRGTVDAAEYKHVVLGLLFRGQGQGRRNNLDAGDAVGHESLPIMDVQPVQIVDRVQNRVDRLRLGDERDHARVQRTLEGLGSAASTDANLMPYILEGARAYATLGEMCDVLRRVFGTYEEPAFR